jgi:hypothetical protein
LTKRLYKELSSCFFHIAHFNVEGFKDRRHLERYQLLVADQLRSVKTAMLARLEAKNRSAGAVLLSNSKLRQSITVHR